MRIIVCGSHTRGSRDDVFAKLDYLHEKCGISFLAQGGAAFVDRFAKEWAVERGVENQEWPADWNQHSMSAGPIRNRKMLAEAKPDGIVAFPGDNGTADMVEIAWKAGLKVWFPFGRDSVRRRARKPTRR